MWGYAPVRITGALVYDSFTAECPANFTYIASVRRCYKVVTQRLNWTAAGRACEALHDNAHLVVINDGRQQSAIAEFLVSNRVSVRICVCIYSALC